ncbi:MAG: dTDP-glucose 4,6-dehydratase [Nitrososphaera sp.]|nr:dTDP-glucose 4,6-dehydratase [Nitrososphaera sp.]
MAANVEERNETAAGKKAGKLRLLVTGGAGFIGSNFIRVLLRETDHDILNVDNLSIRGSIVTIDEFEESKKYRFLRGDIRDESVLMRLVCGFEPDAVIHFAAHSHVDRSIDKPDEFISSNVVGTFSLLQTARNYWNRLPKPLRESFRFLHVSTDEVYGSLNNGDPAFRENDPYRPNSPYSASKASSNHLARAWHHTFKLPVIITNCSNNYGPYQFPEKLIPLLVSRAVAGKDLPIYGTGHNIRDWLYVEDHVRALLRVMESGKPGESYNIGGASEKTNLEVVWEICSLLDELVGRRTSHKALIRFVADRPGHDWRYALNTEKITNELGWRPLEDFSSGLRKTVCWYLDNLDWCNKVTEKFYDGRRLGLGNI